MQWIEITVNTAPELLPKLEARLTALDVSGFITEDAADVERFLETNKKYWDYVDEEFLNKMRGVCRVKFYVEDTDEGRRELARLSDALPGFELLTAVVRDEDWENNWREYYKPIPVGERLMIVPEWLSADTGGRVPLRLDPGLIFGTGAHATTQLCLAALEREVREGDRVLDLGCGSGILAIAALLLGAESATGVDIDEKAPKVVMDNAALNEISGDRLTAICGDVMSDKALISRLADGGFRVVVSNIVADVIIALCAVVPKLLPENGVWISSGVIDGREREVEAAIRATGMTIERHDKKDNWHAFVCVK